ncbi:hypothetical protein M4F77_003698 [Vibrio alginolyticus]|nr:hypothetical protein [Vibrio alginolyticus]
MARTREITNNIVTTNDPRIIRHFERRIFVGDSATSLKAREDLPLNSRVDDINREILKTKANVNEINSYISKLNNEFINSYIQRSSFDWIENNNTLMCYILWSILKLLTTNKINAFNKFYSERKITKEDLSFSHDEIFSSSFFTLTITENDLCIFPNKNKKEKIIELVDSLDLNIEMKLNLIKAMQEKYLEIQEADYLGWIDEKDNVQPGWIISYLKKNKLNIDFLVSNGISSYYAIVSSFFLWDYKSIHEVCGSKDMFIFKVRKAWNQKKHRDNNKKKKKKEYNILMSDDIGYKMEFIAESHESKKNKVVEMLINKEYQRLKNGI